MTSLSSFVRQGLAGLRVLLVMTLVVGIAYPLAVFAVGRLVPGRADGSYVQSGGAIVGSRLIGQKFAGAKWFHSRPSAAGDGYDTLSSAASNLGPNNADLLALVRQRSAAVVKGDGVTANAVPPDAVTASGSGLDPDISPAYARLQVARVARARRLDPSAVAGLVAQHTAGRDLGFIGEEHVNVLELNLALQGLGH